MRKRVLKSYSFAFCFPLLLVVVVEDSILTLDADEGKWSGLIGGGGGSKGEVIEDGVGGEMSSSIDDKGRELITKMSVMKKCIYEEKMNDEEVWPEGMGMVLDMENDLGM